MGPISCREASVRNFHSRLRNKPEERNLIYFAVEVCNRAQCPRLYRAVTLLPPLTFLWPFGHGFGCASLIHTGLIKNDCRGFNTLSYKIHLR
jgi:hypothetical protein